MNIKFARILLFCVALSLLALAWLGIRGGIQQSPQSRSPAQRIQTPAQFAYGLLSLLTLVSVASRRRFAQVVRTSWLICLTLAGGLAPVAWGASGWGAGLIAGLGSLLVGMLMWWLLERAIRGQTCA